MNPSKIPHFFQNYDFTFEKVKSLIPGKTTSNLNYLSFEMTSSASLQFGGSDKNQAYVDNVFTDKNSDDIGVGILYNDENLVNFRNIMNRKLQESTGISCLQNMHKKSEITLAFHSDSNIWLKEETGKLSKITSQKKKKLVEFFKKHAHAKTSCDVIACFNGGTIFPKEDTIYYQEEWKITTIYLREATKCKNCHRDWISACVQPATPVATPLMKPPSPQLQKSSELSDSIESDHIDVVNLDDDMKDDEDEDDPLARLSDLDISLTLNKSVLQK